MATDMISSAFGVVASTHQQYVIIDHRERTVTVADEHQIKDVIKEQNFELSDVPLDLSTKKQKQLNQRNDEVIRGENISEECREEEIDHENTWGSKKEFTVTDIKITNVRSIANERGCLPPQDHCQEIGVTNKIEMNDMSSTDTGDQSCLTLPARKRRMHPDDTRRNRSPINVLIKRASPRSIRGFKRSKPRQHFRGINRFTRLGKASVRSNSRDNFSQSVVERPECLKTNVDRGQVNLHERVSEIMKRKPALLPR